MSRHAGAKTPTKPVENLLERALRLLSKRDYSEAELRSRLLGHGGEEAEVSSIISRLKGAGYLDDRRLAARAAEEARDSRLVGKRRVAQELLARQVDEPNIQQALDKAFDGTNEDERALQHLRGKLQPFLAGDRLEAPGELRRAYGRLRRAGFGHGASVRALQAHSLLAREMDDTDTEHGDG